MKTIRISAEYQDREFYIIYKQDMGSRWSIWTFNPITRKDCRIEGAIHLDEVLAALRRLRAADREYNISYALEGR